MIIWAIIPVKPLSESKSRLAHLLSTDQRAALMYQFLDQSLTTLTAVSTISQTLVISSDPVVLSLAQQHHALTLAEEIAQGLNRAVFQATAYAAQNHVDATLILPADLPFMQAQDIEAVINDFQTTDLLPHPRLAICTDDNQDGTNALLLPPTPTFQFQYGPNSFNKHIREAIRLEMHAHVIHAPTLQFDLDTESDWHHYMHHQV